MHKRCVFLEHAVGVTGLSNVQVIRDRAEVILLLCRAFKLARLVCAAENICFYGELSASRLHVVISEIEVQFLLFEPCRAADV